MRPGDETAPRWRSRKEQKQGGTLWRRNLMTGRQTITTQCTRASTGRKDGTTFSVRVRVGGVVYCGERMILASCS